AEDGIRDRNVTGVQTCALPISGEGPCTLLETGLGRQSVLPAHGTFDGQLDIGIGLLRRFVVLPLGGGSGLVFLPLRDGSGFVGLGCRFGLVGLRFRRTYFGGLVAVGRDKPANGCESGE